MKIIVTVRFTIFDKHFINHFFNYYLNIGVNLFLINFNYKINCTDEELNNLIQYITNIYGTYIKYNIGPNGITSSEEDNINMLKQLVNEYINLDEDFILPTDSDEFHEFIDFNNIYAIINYMIDNNIDYIRGYTCERITDDGSIKEIINNINIFDQFPKWNNNLFALPKISLIKAKYYNLLGVGHHYIAENFIIKYNLKDKIISKTNHFRWNLHSKIRIENWIIIFNNDLYTGWKDKNKYIQMLSIFNNSLLDDKLVNVVDDKLVNVDIVDDKLVNIDKIF